MWGIQLPTFPEPSSPKVNLEAPAGRPSYLSSAGIRVRLAQLSCTKKYSEMAEGTGAQKQHTEVKNEPEDTVKPEQEPEEDADVLEEDDDFEEFEEGGMKFYSVFALWL